MQISATVDTRKLEDALHNLAREARVAPGRVMKQEGKQLIEAIIKMTPPATPAQGRAAVSRDLAKVYSTIPAILKKARQGAFDGKAQYIAALSRAARQNDEGAMRNLLTRPVSGIETVSIAQHQRDGSSVAGYTQQRRFAGPPMPEITGGTQIGGALNPNLHLQRRNRQGRVAGRQLSQIVTKSKELNDYRKQVLSRVGWVKAGWMALIRQTGAKVPAWISSTRLDSVSGTAQTNFGERPFIRATNFNVKIRNYQSAVVDTAIATRVRVTVKKIEALINNRAVNLGFTRVAAR